MRHTQMKNIFVLALLAVIALGSCSKFLEEDNKGGINNEDFYQTEAGYTNLMTAAYSSLRTTFGTNAPSLLVSGTDMYQMNRGLDNRGLMEYTQLFADDEAVLEFYTNCYSALQTINMGIYYNEIAEVDAAKKSSWLAELHFLRGFYHFLLIEQFGGIIINQEPTIDGSRLDLPRASLEDSYQFVIDELETALPGLGTDRFRVNKATANHYLAKVYLTRAWDLERNEDFETAKQYASAAIDGYTISIPFEELWSPFNENNQEVMFAVQYSSESLGNVDEGNNQQGLFGPYLGGPELNHKYMTTTFNPSWSLHTYFGENDARYDATFMLTLYDQYFDYYDENLDKEQIIIRAHYPRVWGREYTEQDEAAWRAAHAHQIAESNFRFYPFRYNEEAYRANYQVDISEPVIKKFDSPSTRQIFGSEVSVRNIVLARKAESYFLYAEACIGLQDFATAAQYVQAVLDRPGNAKDGGTLAPNTDIAAASSQDAALDALLIESAKEFAGEYLRWPELRRVGKLKEFCGRYNYDIKRVGVDVAFRGRDGQDKIYRPIPQNAIDINEAEIQQNPGY